VCASLGVAADGDTSAADTRHHAGAVVIIMIRLSSARTSLGVAAEGDTLTLPSTCAPLNSSSSTCRVKVVSCGERS